MKSSRAREAGLVFNRSIPVFQQNSTPPLPPMCWRLSVSRLISVILCERCLDHSKCGLLNFNPQSLGQSRMADPFLCYVSYLRRSSINDRYKILTFIQEDTICKYFARFVSEGLFLDEVRLIYVSLG